MKELHKAEQHLKEIEKKLGKDNLLNSNENTRDFSREMNRLTMENI